MQPYFDYLLLVVQLEYYFNKIEMGGILAGGMLLSELEYYFNKIEISV